MNNIEMKKCINCKASFSLNLFRDGHHQCRDCENMIQKKNRRERTLSTGMRKDPTRAVTDIESKAMLDLYEKCGWTQREISEVFNISQPWISQLIRRKKE